MVFLPPLYKLRYLLPHFLLWQAVDKYDAFVKFVVLLLVRPLRRRWRRPLPLPWHLRIRSRGKQVRAGLGRGGGEHYHPRPVQRKVLFYSSYILWAGKTNKGHS